MITAIIVEDETRNAKVLNELIKEVSNQIKVVSIAHSIQAGIQAIRKLRPRLVFLDIKMPYGTGFDLLEQLGEIDFDVIFTTAFEHYAIKAIKFSALDYLLKPIDEEELRVAIQKVKQKQAAADQQQNIELLLKSLRSRVDVPAPLEKIALPTLKGYRFILVKDIIYCKADGTYCKVYLADQMIVVSRNLKDIENLLSDHSFFRVHRSYLINMNHATEYIKGDGGQVFLSNGFHLPVSQRRRELFVKQLLNKLD